MSTQDNSNSAKIPPSPNRSDPPDFYKLDADTFEEMTNALYEKEPGISRADLYRTKFKPQYGIDVYAERSDGSGIEVASCKCYQFAAKGKIPEWGYDFLKHLDTHWKGKNVKKFVLATAAYVNSAEREAEVQKEKERFKKHGIQYEVWAPRNLQSKLRSHRGIVSQYLGPYWLNVLCGEAILEAPTQIDRAPVVTFQIARQIADLQEMLSSRVLEDLNFEKENIRKGMLSSVENNLSTLRQGKEWDQLSPDAQAKVIRLQASICLQRNALAEAEKLAADADAITVKNGVRMRALISFKKDGPLAGLSCLENVTEAEDLQLKVALLIESEKLDEARELLSTPGLVNQNDAETFRLKAFVALLSESREEAYTWIQEAERLAGDWIAVRRAGATIRYALALSPAVPRSMYLNPNPLDRDLLRLDARSQLLMKEALERFRSLLESEPDVSARSIDVGWELACLCNIQDEQDAARKFCLKLVAAEPGNALAVAWALIRGFDFDKNQSLLAIQETLESGNGDITHVFTAGWLLLDMDKIVEARDILEKYKDRFQSQEEELVRRERVDRFNQILSGAESDPFTPGSTEQLALFEKSMTEVPLPPVGLLLAEQLGAVGKWEMLYKHIDHIEQYQTPAAIRIAAYAAFNTGNADHTLEILNTHKNSFFRSILPRDLRQMEVQAIALTKGPAAAHKYANELAAETGDIQDRLSLARLAINIGDITGAIPIIREASNANILSQSEKLSLSLVVAREDSSLGKELWLTAVNAGLPDNLVPLAFLNAYSLGLDRETAKLLPQYTALSSQAGSGIEAKSINELAAFISGSAEQFKQALSSYASGAVPIHAAAALYRLSFPRIYRLREPSLMAVPLPQVAYIRHGGRDAISRLERPLNAVPLRIDVTGLLIAAQLKLLDVIEKVASPVVIAASTSLALIEIEKELSPNQPIILDAFKEIQNAISRGRIKIWQTPEEAVGESETLVASRHIAEKSGLVVDHALPDASDESELATITSVSKVIDGLVANGAIRENSLKAAKAQTAPAVRDDFGQEPAAGTPLVFMTNTLTVMAQVGCLKETIDIYDVYVSKSFVDEVDATLIQASGDASYREEVATLRRRVSAGIQSGRYICTAPAPEEPYGTASGDAVRNARNAVNSPILDCMFEIMNVSPDEESVIWTDDRFLTGYLNCNKAQIVGIVEVLDELLKANHISKRDYYQALTSLRASMTMFIPISDEEVQHHLNSANIVDGTLVENVNLATLRRYFATFMQYAHNLKLGQVTKELQNRPDEPAAMQQMGQLFMRCITTVWNQGYPNASGCEAKSNWIWDALRHEESVQQLTGPSGEKIGQSNIAGMLTGILLSSVFQLKMVKADGHLPSDELYLKWAADKIAAPRIHLDPSLAQRAAEYIKFAILNVVPGDTENPEATDARTQWLNFAGALVPKLPDEITSLILKAPELREALRIVTFPEMRAGENFFNGRELLPAVESAIQHGMSEVQNRDKTKTIRIERHPSERWGVTLVDGQDKLVVVDEAYALLFNSLEECRALLQRNIGWFEVAEAKRNELVERIIAIEDKYNRFFALEEARQNSISTHYVRIDRHRNGGDSIPLQELVPPSGRALLDYLRLPTDSGTSFPAQLDTAAEALIKDHGVEVAFNRLIGLPTAMPACIVDELSALGDVEITNFLQRLLNAAQTPLRLFHTLSLVRQVNRADTPSAKAYIDRYIQKWDELAGCFAPVLRWVSDAYSSDADWETLNSTQKLAVTWSHADRVTQFLLSVGVSLETVQSIFSKRVNAHAIDAAFHLSPEKEDIACPEYIFEDSLLLHGLAYILGGKEASSLLSQEQISGLSEKFTKLVEPEGSKLVSPFLRIYSEAGANSLGSFLADRPNGLLEGEIEPSSAKAFEFQVLLAESLDADNVEPWKWTILWAIARPALHADVGKSVARSIDKLSKSSLIAISKDNEVGIQAIVQLAVKFGDENLRTSLRDKLLEIMQAQIAQFSSSKILFVLDEKSERADYLQRALNQFIMLSESKDPEAARRFFGDTMLMIAEIWPLTTRALKQLVERVYEQSNINYARPLWEIRMALQARL